MLNKLGFNTTIYGDDQYSGIKRVQELREDDYRITYKEIRMQQHRGIGRIMYHKFPSIDSLRIGALNLIMLWRVPSRNQIMACTDSSSKCILLLHGIGIDRLHFANLTVILYQLYLRLQLHLKRPILSDRNLYFQVLNDFQYDYLCRLLRKPENIFLIKNGVQSGSYMVGRNDDIFKVIFIGRIENVQKGIRRLLRVSQILSVKRPELKFEIIGSGSYSSKIENTKNLTYSGFVTSEEKVKVLKEAGLLVITSNMDPSPAVVIEALLSGLPVVGTPVSGIAGMLKLNSLYGDISGFNPNAFSDSIIKYFDLWRGSPERYFLDKIERRNRAIEDFSFDRMIKEYETMIRKVFSR